MVLYSTGPGSRITGLGHYQPERVMTNDDLARIVDTNDEWIRTRTGIRERRIAAAEQTVAELATAAGRMALEDAGLSTVSMVIVASTSSSHRTPNASGIVAAELGLGGPAVIDIDTACSGFEYALALADQAIRAGSARSALVIGAELLSRFTDWTDRRTCVLTADGAGAVVIEATEEAGIGPVVWGSVPELVDAVRIEGEPPTFDQDGQSIFRWAITRAAGEATRVVTSAGLSLEDIDVFAFHQANLRIIEPLADALGAGDRIVIRDIEVSGNTSAASVPLGLSKAWHSGSLPAGGTALLFGFGGGFTYAGQVVVLPETTRLDAAGRRPHDASGVGDTGLEPMTSSV